MKPIVGITMGDPAGIGPEVVLKALARPEIYQMARPIVIGDLSIMKRDSRLLGLDVGVEPIDGVERAKFRSGQVEVLSASDVDLTGLEYGRVDPRAGEAAVNSVFKAIDLALAEKLDAIVTAPLNKEAMQLAGFKYPGHTELLAEKTGPEDFSLMLVPNKLRVIPVTTPTPMRRTPVRRWIAFWPSPSPTWPSGRSSGITRCAFTGQEYSDCFIEMPSVYPENQTRSKFTQKQHGRSTDD